MLFADNIYEINMHRCIHVQWQFPVNPFPCFRLYFILPLLHNPTLLFTYLEILLLLLVVRMPIYSHPRLAINCSPLAASPTPRHPIDQVTYLHRRHQQHQPSRLTHVEWWNLSQKNTSITVNSVSIECGTFSKWKQKWLRKYKNDINDNREMMTTAI